MERYAEEPRDRLFGARKRADQSSATRALVQPRLNCQASKGFPPLRYFSSDVCRVRCGGSNPALRLERHLLASRMSITFVIIDITNVITVKRFQASMTHGSS
jgi:hypothetical protein